VYYLSGMPDCPKQLLLCAKQLRAKQLRATIRRSNLEFNSIAVRGMSGMVVAPILSLQLRKHTFMQIHINTYNLRNEADVPLDSICQKNTNQDGRIPSKGAILQCGAVSMTQSGVVSLSSSRDADSHL
jgi:hypothetical protein